MERSRRLSTLWNWLPAFRAVAETEHLPTASEALHVSPSALSRTIKLLEEDVGQPLFDRAGRNIVLNQVGRTFLRSVRDAMRTLDEGLGILADRQLVGPVHISVPGPFAPIFVFPALDSIAAKHPNLVPHIQGLASPQVNQLLLRGQIDLALLDDPIPSADLTIDALTTITHGVYCAEGHALYRARRITQDRICEHPFVAPVADETGTTPDAWPPHLSRPITLRVTRMQVGVDACLRGTHLCVLPDVVARRVGLRRLPCCDLTPTTLYMLHRPSLPILGKTELLAEAIRAAAH
jgi:LysR family cyn operon transcriptional activator